MPKKKKSEEIASQFSDEEMEQIKRYGQALGGKPTPFDEEVQEHLDGMEANAHKMHAAQTGGGGDVNLAPTEMESTAAKQRGSIAQQTDTQADIQAQKAQAAQAPTNAPPAPAGPAGTNVPYPAQAGPQPQPQAPTPAQPPPGGPPQPPEEGEGEDPSTQWPEN
jgi:hypothetical protein